METTNGLAAFQIDPAVIPAARALGDYPFTLGSGSGVVSQAGGVLLVRAAESVDLTAALSTA